MTGDTTLPDPGESKNDQEVILLNPVPGGKKDLLMEEIIYWSSRFLLASGSPGNTVLSLEWGKNKLEWEKIK